MKQYTVYDKLINFKKTDFRSQYEKLLSKQTLELMHESEKDLLQNGGPYRGSKVIIEPNAAISMAHAIICQTTGPRVTEFYETRQKELNFKKHQKLTERQVKDMLRREEEQLQIEKRKIQKASMIYGVERLSTDQRREIGDHLTSIHLLQKDPAQFQRRFIGSIYYTTEIGGPDYKEEASKIFKQRMQNQLLPPDVTKVEDEKKTMHDIKGLFDQIW